MDASATPLGKPARLRHWFARHLVALVATLIVLGILGWKNQYQLALRVGQLGHATAWVSYGWPRACVDRVDDLKFVISAAQPFTPNSPSIYSVRSWPSLLLDSAIAAVSLIVIWILFSHTQRRCQRWWQLSLTSLLAFVALAAVICVVLKSDSIGAGDMPVQRDDYQSIEVGTGD
jgi:hypothetical protein